MKTNSLLLLTGLLTFAARQMPANSSDLDVAFNPGSSLNGPVTALARQPDGKLIIGGEFTTLHDSLHNHIARLHPDGTTDESYLAAIDHFEHYPSVWGLTFQADGKLLVNGWFTEVNGQAQTNLVRLNPDGTRDAAFLPGGLVLQDIWGNPGSVDLILVQPDQKILMTGWFVALDGVLRTNMARLQSDGSVDDGFKVDLVSAYSPGMVEVGQITALCLQADGKIIIGGAFNSVNGVARTNLARLNADGSLDSEFMATVEFHEGDGVHPGDIASLVVQTDGRILIGGRFTLVNGVMQTNIVRLNPDGSFDASFSAVNTHRDGRVAQMLLLPNDSVLARGGFSADGENWWQVMQFDMNGRADAAFQPPAIEDEVVTMLRQPDGRVVLGGDFWSVGTLTRHGVARLQADGTPDAVFDNGAPLGVADLVSVLAVQPDGKILVAGDWLHRINGREYPHLARLLPDGSVDESFAPVPDIYQVQALALQPNGKILLGGHFPLAPGNVQYGILRLNADGSRDTNFSNGFVPVNETVTCIRVQTNGQILIAGYFTQVQQHQQVGYARLNPDGVLDPDFAHEFYFAPVRDVALQDDGRIVLVGDFGIRQLDPDGRLDSTFHAPWVNGVLFAVTMQSNARILIGGNFDSVGGQSRQSLARLQTDGTPDETFTNSFPGMAALIWRLELEADGKIIIAGQFRPEVSDIFESRLIRLRPDGSPDPTLAVNLSRGAIECIAAQADGKVLIGGEFSVVNQTARRGVARLMGACVPPILGGSPHSQTVEEGAVTRLAVQATGFPAPCYQWYFNDTNLLADGTNAVFRITAAQASMAGSYSVIIFNAGGSITTAPVLLQVISPVNRRTVPGLRLPGSVGDRVNLEWAASLAAPSTWIPLETIQMSDVAQYWFDLSLPLPPQRFYRGWQTNTTETAVGLALHFIPTLTLTGNVADVIRVEGINAVGPTDAWFKLADVTLTNSPQLYFDVSTLGQPARLYRLTVNP